MSRAHLIYGNKTNGNNYEDTYYNWSKHQQLMPRLPVPSLHDTIEGYLSSVKHLLSTEEYEVTKNVANDFLLNEGKNLHEELLERNRQAILLNENTSFVRPFWNDMYLCGRYANPINSNPFFVLDWDARNTTQAKRASSLVCAFTQFYHAMNENRLAPDIAGTQPQCMDEYSRLFACSRIPMSGKDQWRSTKNSRHIAILRGSKIYTLPIIADDGIIPENTLTNILDDLLKNTINQSNSEDVLLGNLCSWSRNEWASVRSKIATTHAESLDLIDSAIFVLCLDYIDPGDSFDVQCNIALHGGGQHRWYDKTFNLSVAPNAAASVNFEHSMYDGAAIRRLLDETWLKMREMDTGRPDFNWKWSNNNNVNNWSHPKQVDLNFPEHVFKYIHDATEFHTTNINSVNVSFLDFQQFGKNKAKTFKCSPDGLVQICLQWAYYRLHNKSPGFCYEPASTKGFLCGRTEVVRASTKASSDFVDYMVGNNVNKAIAIELLQNACNEHSKNARNAVNGKGVDRHLFSLFKIAQLRGGEIPAIYRDKAWEVSNTSIISTSNVTSEMIRCVGFGPVVPNGYGIAYGILNDTINLSASNFTQVVGSGDGGFGGVTRETKEYTIDTDCQKFCKMVGQCLIDIEKMFEIES